MKRMQQLLAITVSLLAMSTQAYDRDTSTKTPEYFQALSIGKKDISVTIPSRYQIVHHDIVDQKQIIGFIPENTSLNNWPQYVSVEVSLNSSESAGQKMRRVEAYIKNTYQESEIIDTKVRRRGDGIEEATIAVRFKDEVGDTVLYAKYYSDNAKLIGTEVSQRVEKSADKARNSARKTAQNVLVLR